MMMKQRKAKKDKITIKKFHNRVSYSKGVITSRLSFLPTHFRLLPVCVTSNLSFSYRFLFEDVF